MLMMVLTRASLWREAVRRAWKRATTPWHAEIDAMPESLAAGEQSLVSALCTCVLGDRGDAGASATSTWPPQSVEELTRHQPGASTAGFAGDALASLLEQGLAALDAVALQETGWRFSRVDRRTQLRAVFRLESGQGGLPRRQAAAFIDAFLTLAAQLYLRDALAPAPVK